MFIVLIRRTCPGLNENILTPIRLQALNTSRPCFLLMVWSPVIVRGCGLSILAVTEVHLHFSCPKVSDRLLYQSEAEQLVLERGLVVEGPEIPLSVFLGAPLESRVSKMFLTI